jgi:hypothetical protein
LKGEFTPSDFTVDSRRRLLVVGTARFRVGADDPLEPSTVRIVRFRPNGRLDRSFGQQGVIETNLGLPPPLDGHGRPLRPHPSIEAVGVAVDRRGRIVVTGGADIGLRPSCEHDILPRAGRSAAFVARLTRGGFPDPSFGGDGVVGGEGLSETPLRAATVGDPVINRSGTLTYRTTSVSKCLREHGRWGVAQLSPGGRTLRRLGRKGAVDGYFTAIASAPNGAIVASAIVERNAQEAFRSRLIRIGPNGVVDRSFGQGGQALVKLGVPFGNEIDALAIDAKGRILVGGTLATGERTRAPNGKLAARAILVLRLSADGRQEMGFGPNGRIATPFPGLLPSGLSDLFLDSEGRVVTVHQYATRNRPETSSGLLLARYLVRN